MRGAKCPAFGVWDIVLVYPRGSSLFATQLPTDKTHSSETSRVSLNIITAAAAYNNNNNNNNKKKKKTWEEKK